MPNASFIAAITISEVLIGSYLANTEARRREREVLLDTVLSQCEVIPFRELEAREHARVRVELRRLGTQIGDADLIIAATALANGHSVMTNNLREFRQVPGLEVVTGPAS